MTLVRPWGALTLALRPYSSTQAKRTTVTARVLLGLQSPCHQEDSPSALISSAIFRFTSLSTLCLRFLWGGYWHLRTRRSESDPSCARYLRHIVKSRLLLFLNKPIRARISFFSDETNFWDTLTSRLLNVLLCYSPMNFEVWAIGVLDSARKMTFGSTVSCKWTRQLRCLESLNSSFRLNWGLFRRSQTYVALIWRRITTDTSTLHRINNLCCAVERWRKILLEV